jgi:hypothetical protein
VHSSTGCHIWPDKALTAHCLCTILQAEGSCYEFIEARVGGSLTRHDLGIQQEGPETTTSMKHFILAGAHKDCCVLQQAWLQDSGYSADFGPGVAGSARVQFDCGCDGCGHQGMV